MPALTAPVDSSVGSDVGSEPATEAPAPDASASAAASGDANASGSDAALSQRSAKLYFDVGKSQPPANAEADLAGVVAALKDDANTKARISGFHDETGSAATNAELAKKRAQAVQQWLESQGIVADRIVLDKPAIAVGGGDAKQARRVEITVE
ncbi:MULTISPECIES: OmpA family protein [unclassified Lysobacter]|uniref:OmpA family protein n=1 Tax=unclassified Lysobacter TaxID=2635362 RepID=UPI002035BFE8|nr:MULTISPECIES: OmpA family protein [unclassified Lysobacter]